MLKFDTFWTGPQRIIHVCALHLMLGWTITENVLKLLQWHHWENSVWVDGLLLGNRKLWHIQHLGGRLQNKLYIASGSAPPPPPAMKNSGYAPVIMQLQISTYLCVGVGKGARKWLSVPHLEVAFLTRISPLTGRNMWLFVLLKNIRGATQKFPKFECRSLTT
jgi:hypothetical protein